MFDVYIFKMSDNIFSYIYNLYIVKTCILMYIKIKFLTHILGKN